jgi:hypothetical protein
MVTLKSSCVLKEQKIIHENNAQRYQNPFLIEIQNLLNIIGN